MSRTVIIGFAVLFCVQALWAHPSWGIVVDSHRNIYFADIVHNGRGSVWKLSHDGKLSLLLSDFHAHNVCLDNKGRLVTAHGEGDHTMLRLEADGTFDTLVRTQDHNAFFGGNCSYTPQGNIIFGIDNHIWRLDPAGDKYKVSNHYFKWNQSLYADDEGNIYAPDIGDGKGQLVRIDNAGNAEVIANKLITKLDRPYEPHNDILLGVTKGCDGLIYIAEMAGKRIIKINDNEHTSTFYTSTGHWFPTGVDFFAGDAYILEYKDSSGISGPRIVKIDESGNTSVLFDYEGYHNKDMGHVPPVLPGSPGSPGGGNLPTSIYLALLVLIFVPGLVLFFRHTAAVTIPRPFFRQDQRDQDFS